MLSLVTGTMLVLFMAAPVSAASSSVVAAGARYHTAHSVFSDLPYDDGDLSYLLAYEYHDADAAWQLAVGYAPDVTGVDTVDYVVTPQLNLILKDNIWRAGVGILYSYIHDDIEGGDWTDLYWQLLLGIRIPLFGLQLGADAVYPFEEWDVVDEFDTDDLEYHGWLGFKF